VEVQGVGVLRGVVDGAHGQLQVDGEDIAHQGDPVARLEAVPVGEAPADDTGRAVPQKSGLLVLRDAPFAIDGEELVGIEGEASEHVGRVAGVFVDAAEPLDDGHFAHAGHPADLLLVGFGHGEGERDLVAGDQTESLRGRRVAEVEGVINSQQHAQQAKRRTDAEDREGGAPAVAPAVFQHQRQKPQHRFHSNRAVHPE